MPMLSDGGLLNRTAFQSRLAVTDHWINYQWARQIWLPIGVYCSNFISYNFTR